MNASSRAPSAVAAAACASTSRSVAGARFHGLRHLTLNSALEDPSFVAERLTYLVYRDAGLVAPRASSAVKSPRRTIT